ncbi:esterase [[Bacillus] enclensis]|uniref:Predicted hydrolase of the alpha/beta superfamily n=1 Tax=[Bacillus] enclensis TaxID=1402860 RepID=A0A0V8HPT0_9BACI|nr:alpha/beta hydrolase-fold protein [[Bacillus] enclensis]KSU64613.1 esterase [[Bacillus] enclensis]SCB77098.1 Predicted hydrolase of the alpha/beta superfamily [[Bacillus] enclensis]
MLETFPIHMTSFKQDRQIRVYLPKGYNHGKKKYPVLYMHDGQNVFNDEDAIGGTSLELEKYLDERGLEVIVVGIDLNTEDRLNEYCPWVNGEYSRKIIGQLQTSGGKGKEYVEFIVNELKPFIDKNYRTIKDHTAMAGISLGGLISVYAMCRYPHIFRNIAVFSSAFFRNQEEIEKLIKESDLSLVETIYLDSGDKESGNKEMINKEFLHSNKVIYDLLKEKVPRTEFEIISDGEHSYAFFKERAPMIFSFLTE